MEESATNVTQRILNRHITYGSSDNTNPSYSASNKSLNYAAGGSIQSPENDRVSIIPFTLNYSDTVGLFGKENHFIRVNVDIDKDIAFACYEEPGWECAVILPVEVTDNTYLHADTDFTKDLTTVNTYEPAKILPNALRNIPDSFISIDLENLKTGNKFIDAWFDVRLYTKNREEHPYDKMYVRLHDYFYIGFHARNTKRLPYNVKCVIGEEYVVRADTEDERYIAR